MKEPKFSAWNRNKTENIKGKVIRIPMTEEGYVWQERSKIPPVSFRYGLASGGFGCKASSMGNAIFVHFVAENYREFCNLQALNVEKSERWEKYFPIEIMEVE